MNYLAFLSCDYGTYTADLIVIYDSSNQQQAERFASSCILGVEISESNIHILTSDDVNITRSWISFRHVKPEAYNKIIWDADDYEAIENASIFTCMCAEYGSHDSFMFHNSAYSVKRCCQ